jgi:hypothetical protein
MQQLSRENRSGRFARSKRAMVRFFPMTGSSVRTRIVAFGALLAALLVLAPVAGARTTANPVLNVNFFVNGSIAVSLGDGTAVGTASGAPTTIPGGYYTVLLTGPGGCANVPYFELKGPGENIVDDMDEGELATFTYNAYFMPNSTYTWKNDNVNPPVTNTFVTNGQTLGAAAVVAAPGGNTSTGHGTQTSTNPFGPKVLPSLGKLTGVVSAGGKLTLTYKGKSVKSLKAGKYKITITDKSRKTGFVLQRSKHKLSLTGSRYVGTHSTTVKLTAGSWVLSQSLGKKTFSVVDK